MSNFVGNKFKYSEMELQKRYCGDLIGSSGDARWRLKKDTYTNEGVWGSFTRLRDSFRALYTKSNGFKESDRAHGSAQILMDCFLIHRSRGEAVEVPEDVRVFRGETDGDGSDGLSLMSGEGFKDDPSVTANQQIKWVSENMNREGVDKSEAPSYGTYQMLLHYQGGESRKEKFYDTLFPKLMTKEDADKAGKLEDSGKDTIKLIDRLLLTLPEAV